ncbi:ribonuclease h, partial [Olea europaea subsp. europaea]
ALLLVRIPLLVRWFPPKNGVLKLNTDGSSLDNLGKGGCGGVLRDWLGKLIFGFSHYIGVATNSIVEAFALKFGLYYCYLSWVLIELGWKLTLS